MTAMNNKGITLTELLVVMAIISVIASVAFPAYQNHLRKARRNDGITAIYSLQEKVEDYIVVNEVLPADSDFPEKDSNNGFYTIYYNKQNDDIYRVQAVAKTNTTQENDIFMLKGEEIDCRTMYITNKIDSVYPPKCR